MAAPYVIAAARSRDEIEAVRHLFREYAHSLGIDLSFQHFEEEVVTLPGEYGPPRGMLLVAQVGDATAGCVALRVLDPYICEMKRLYIRPAFRGRGIGEALAHAVIAEARRLDYDCMRLDTLPSMTSARALYKRLGFVEIPAYRFNPIEGTSFLELRLRPPRLR
jgi:ribosomal protein S18 acetylase RimI-like enzyme